MTFKSTGHTTISFRTAVTTSDCNEAFITESSHHTKPGSPFTNLEGQGLTWLNKKLASQLPSPDPVHILRLYKFRLCTITLETNSEWIQSILPAKWFANWSQQATEIFLALTLPLAYTVMIRFLKQKAVNVLVMMQNINLLNKLLKINLVLKKGSLPLLPLPRVLCTAPHDVIC